MEDIGARGNGHRCALALDISNSFALGRCLVSRVSLGCYFVFSVRFVILVIDISGFGKSACEDAGGALRWSVRLVGKRPVFAAVTGPKGYVARPSPRPGCSCPSRDRSGGSRTVRGIESAMKVVLGVHALGLGIDRLPFRLMASEGDAMPLLDLFDAQDLQGYVEFSLHLSAVLLRVVRASRAVGVR
jgi:hypothetical protein